MNNSEYRENIVDQYQMETKISCNDFHYGSIFPRIRPILFSKRRGFLEKSDSAEAEPERSERQ
ncbi:MAG: hypothetical protein KAS17_04585, partial [Victivallaceae bacterium]|nr:hypothetical protein [Victivallaceae bacterium]